MTAQGGHQGEGGAQSRVAASGDMPARGSGPSGSGGIGAVTDAGAARGGAGVPFVSAGWQGLAALAVYLGVWVLAEVFPLVVHPGWPQLDRASMDPNIFVWGLRWWPFAVGHGLNPFFSAQVAAPAGADLAWVTTVPPLALLVSPVTVLAGPVVSFNLLVALSVPVSGWAAFVLCRRLTGRFWPALAGGAVYGFSAYELNHIFAGQLNLAFSLLLPLMAYLVVLWRDERIGSRALAGWLALAMALQFYLFLETFADMTAVWVLALAAGYLLAGRAGRPVVARLARVAAAAYVLALILAAPYLWYALAHVPPGFARSPAKTSVDLAGLVVPRPGQLSGLAGLERYAGLLPTAGRDGYVGVPLLALVVALVVVAWSSRLTRFLAVMVSALIVVALGPVLHVGGRQVVSLPWSGLWFLPFARSAYPARFMVFAFLALAVMVALWLAGPSRRAWLRWLLGLCVLAAVAANTPALQFQRGPGLPAFVTTGAYRHYLARGDTVVVASRRGNTGLLWAAQTSFYTRLAGGYLNAAIAQNTDGLPPPVAGLARGPLTRWKLQQFRSYVSQAKVRAILVEAGSAGRWPAILHQAGLHGQAIGGVILYRTTP